MRSIRFFRRSPLHVADTGPRRLYDVDSRARTEVTHVVRPDSLSTRDVPSATRAVDPGHDAAGVTRAIDRLFTAGGLDEFTADTLDGTIEAWRRVWDSTVDEQLPEQILTTMRLGAQEAENLTACLIRVRRLRATVADLTTEVENWRSVLRGEIEHLPFPPRVAQDGDRPAADPLAMPVDETTTDVGRAAWRTVAQGDTLSDDPKGLPDPHLLRIQALPFDVDPPAGRAG